MGAFEDFPAFRRAAIIRTRWIGQQQTRQQCRARGYTSDKALQRQSHCAQEIYFIDLVGFANRKYDQPNSFGASRISPSVPVITGKSCLQDKPDRAILMLVRALARQAARDDHAREKAKRAAQDEPSRHLHPLLDRSSK